MHHPARRMFALLTALLVMTGVAPMTSASAAAVPKVLDYGAQIDAYAKYEAENTCLYPRSSPGS